jgi:hypothetical protein
MWSLAFLVDVLEVATQVDVNFFFPTPRAPTSVYILLHSLYNVTIVILGGSIAETTSITSSDSLKEPNSGICLMCDT